MKLNLKYMNIRTKLLMGFFFIAFLTGLVGAMGIYFSRQIGKEGEIIAEDLSPRANAIMQVQLSATKAHLLFEEIVAGDTTENIQDVWDFLNESVWYCNAILNGGENQNGKISPTNNVDIREKITAVRGKIEAFIVTAKKRYQLYKASSGAGTSDDQHFDELYQNIQKNLSDIGSKSNDISIVSLSGQSQYHTANAHLFLEELLGGDDSNTEEIILDSFDQAKRNIEKIGKITGKYNVENIIQQYETIMDTSIQRVKIYKNNSSAGSASDEAFDQEYEEFVKTADEARLLIDRLVSQAVINFRGDIETNFIWMSLISGISLLSAFIIANRISRSISNPITESIAFASALANGDMSRDFNLNTKDEFGQLGTALNHISSNLSVMINHIKDNSSTLASASEELFAISSELAKGTDQMNNKSKNVSTACQNILDNIHMVSSSAEEMSVNTSSISSDTVQIYDRMNSVAAAVEETSVAIRDIAKNAEGGATTTRKAMEMAAVATQTINTMEAAAQDIGKVTDVIQNISQKTNLLALNATIEAARAGEAGKGFTVVSNEIKLLADQCFKSASEIAERISEIQKTAQKAVIVVSDVAKTIDSVNDSADNIAVAVEEQSSITDNISADILSTTNSSMSASNSIKELAIGATEMSKKTTEMVADIGEVFSDVSDIDLSLNETSTGVRQITAAAGDLSKLSVNLQALIGKFKVKA